jgi:3-hydroxyisobutyrate dehydrogenase-like beta-hydroxyacid dehydrogenase
MNIGFIGLGAMGLPIAENLFRGKHQVYAFDPSAEACNRAAASGLSVCDSVKETAGKARVIFFSLPNAAVVEQVIGELVQVLPSAPELAVDLSSIAPASARKFASILKTAGIGYADCPISGGVQGARDGTLTVMAGTDSKFLEILIPLFGLIGKKYYHIGEVGTGSAMKMVNNYLLGCNMAAAAEGLVLGAKLGLNTAVMQEVIQSSSGRSFITENKLPGFIMKRRFDGGFQVDLAYKDLGLSVESAKEIKMPIPMGSTAVQVFETARARGFGKEDISSLVKIWEELMGIEV